MRGILDRLKKIGFSIVFLTDVKNELGTSIRPVQPKFQNKLLEGEKPKGMSVAVLRPIFFQTLQGEDSKLPAKNVWYSERFQDLEFIDFNTLMKVDTLTPVQVIAMEDIWDEIQKRMKTSGCNIEDIDEIIDNIDSFTNDQKIRLKYKFRPIRKANIFAPEHQLDVMNALKSGLTISLNMQGFENFGRDNSYPQLSAGMFLRKVINARRAKLIPEVVVAIDEMARFVPRDGDNCCKKNVLESYDVDRRFSINYLSASQSLFDVPEKIVKQSRWVFIPYNVDMEELKFAMKLGGMFRTQQGMNNEASRLKAKLKKFDWLCIDRNTNTVEIFTPLAPLSEHSEVDKT